VVLLTLLPIVYLQKLSCLFLHGSGNTPTAGSGVFDAKSKIATTYWKNIEATVGSFCDKLSFIDAETVLRPWDNAALIDEFCGAIASSGANVVFSHSFGNLVIAAGVAAGTSGCAKIGNAATIDNVHWYLVQGPLKGSPAADKLFQLCEVDHDVLAETALRDACDTSAAPWKVKPAYLSLMTKYESKTSLKGQLSTAACGAAADCKTLADIAKTKAKGEMCGFTPLGEVSLDSILAAIALTAASRLVGSGWGDDEAKGYPNHGNDGLVGWASCDLNGPTYGQTPADAFYKMDGNHARGSCRGDDDSSDATKQPCKWYFECCSKSTSEMLKSTEPPAVAPEPNQSIEPTPVAQEAEPKSEPKAVELLATKESAPLLQHQKSRAQRILMKKMRS